MYALLSVRLFGHLLFTNTPSCTDRSLRCRTRGSHKDLSSQPSNTKKTGSYNEDMIPTVGFNMKRVTKGNVSIKLWDIGGQPRFSMWSETYSVLISSGSMWERYCRGVDAIVYAFPQKLCSLLDLLLMAQTAKSSNRRRKNYTIWFLSPNSKESLCLCWATRTISLIAFLPKNSSNLCMQNFVLLLIQQGIWIL